MISADELTRLMQQAIADKGAEPAFFRALLEATVYVHAPRQDHSGRLRFIQFTTPEGLTVLPFFSDEAQAKDTYSQLAGHCRQMNWTPSPSKLDSPTKHLGIWSVGLHACTTA